nr:hypothetical protein CFP56_30659 [Quercus suber]
MGTCNNIIDMIDDTLCTCLRHVHCGTVLLTVPAMSGYFRIAFHQRGSSGAGAELSALYIRALLYRFVHITRCTLHIILRHPGIFYSLFRSSRNCPNGQAPRRLKPAAATQLVGSRNPRTWPCCDTSLLSRLS